MGICTSKKKVDEIIQIVPYKVCITAFILDKESHHLFDFESNQASKKEIELDFSGSHESNNQQHFQLQTTQLLR